AVVAQRCEQGVYGCLGGTDLVALAPVAHPGHPRTAADQVVHTVRLERASDIAAWVVGHDRVGQRRLAAGRNVESAAVLGGIAADGGVGQRGRGQGTADQATTVVVGGIAADGAVGQRERGFDVVQAGALVG